MFREANLLKKIFLNKNENSGGEAIKGYVDYTYFGLSDEIEKDFFEGDQKAEKRLGYRLREGGEKTSVLVSGSHAMGLINTNLRVSQVEVDDLNKQAENKGVRYSRSKEGFLFLGKHYFDAPQREITKGKGYKADTCVGSMCVEMQHIMKLGNPENVPHVLIYEMSQQYSEPNKVDAVRNKEKMAVIDLSFYREIGAEKFVNYVLKNGVGNIKADELALLRRGEYSKAVEEKTKEEIDQEKKGALLEIEDIVKKIPRDLLEYRKLMTALGVLKIHRSYYEEQERLLYEKTFSEYPVNLEIHTCYNTRKEIEGVEIIIGTRFFRSVADSEMEFILAKILTKHGFNTSMSTLATLPSLKEDKDSLGIFIEKAKEIQGLVSLKTLDKLNSIKRVAPDQLKREFMEIVLAKVNRQIKRGNAGEKTLKLFLKNKTNKTENEIEGLGIDLLKSVIVNYFKEFLDKEDANDLIILLKQQLLNEDFIEKGFQCDHFAGGLVGLTGLINKYEAREKYTTSNRSEIKPAIFQLEIPTMLIEDQEVRRKIELALKEFIEIVQEENFKPQTALQNILVK